MAKVFFIGLMGELMKVNIRMIRNTDLVYIHGLMASDMKVTGTKANNMEQVNFIIKKENRLKENGIVESVLGGLEME